MADDRTVKALNTLVMHVSDSADGYEQAAQVANSGQIESEFRALARERREIAQELAQRVTQLGGDPKTNGSVQAGAHRLFLNLRSVFENDTKAAIKEVERGEDRLLEAFRDAQGDVSPSDAAFVSDIGRRVQMDHDRWSALKHQIDAADKTGRSGMGAM